jgi:hypothetical protein
MAQGKEAFKRGLRQTKHGEKRMTRLTHQRKLQNREGKYNMDRWKATKTYRPDYIRQLMVDHNGA